MKKIAVFLLVIALIAGGGFWFLTGGALNDLVKTQIETIGQQVTGQTVTVKTVDIKLFEGAGTIKGLVLANPEKYNADAAFLLNEVTLAINLSSLTTDVIVIDKIIINQPEAVVEFAKSGRSNIQDILDAMNKNMPASTTKETVEQSTSAQAEPIIRVNQFVLAGVALTVDLSQLGNKAHKKTLTDIKLINIGGDAGMPASQLGAELMKQALSSIWQQAKKEQKKLLKDKLKNKLKDKVKNKLKGLFK